MRRIQIQNLTDNKTFSVKLNSNSQTFKTPITKVSNSITTTAKLNESTVSASVNTSSHDINHEYNIKFEDNDLKEGQPK